eukprot:jgi/Tetstr1/455740/TSEL_042539.t1
MAMDEESFQALMSRCGGMTVILALLAASLEAAMKHAIAQSAEAAQPPADEADPTAQSSEATQQPAEADPTSQSAEAAQQPAEANPSAHSAEVAQHLAEADQTT